VKFFDWDDAKNAKLGRSAPSGLRRSSSTSSVATCSTSWNIRTANRYAGQRIFVVRREDQVYLVPFVEDEHTVFLKTIPSRKATKRTSGRSPTMKLDAEEKELLESVERGEWKSAKGGKRSGTRRPCRQ
jgi:hypothetical protein